MCTYPQNEIIPIYAFLASPVQDFIQNQNVCMVGMCVCVIVGDSNTKSSSFMVIVNPVHTRVRWGKVNVSSVHVLYMNVDKTLQSHELGIQLKGLKLLL